MSWWLVLPWMAPYLVVSFFNLRCCTLVPVRIDLRAKGYADVLPSLNRSTLDPRYWLLWNERQWINFLRKREGDGLGQKAEGEKT